jgi:YD repeat-containing protein
VKPRIAGLHRLEIISSKALVTVSKRKCPASIVLIAFVAFIFHVQISKAQGTPSTDIGLPINATFSGGQIDSVQLNNGNLHIDIPLLHLPGIGMDTDIHYVYDSQALQSVILSNGQQEIVSPRPLWMYQDHASGGRFNVQETEVQWGPCGGGLSGESGESPKLTSVTFTDDSGSSHYFPIMGYPPNNHPPGLSGPNCESGTYPITSYPEDSSGYKVTMDDLGNIASVLDKHGRSYTGVSIEDENGNTITETQTIGANLQTYTLTDTVNRQITHKVNTGTGHSGPPYDSATSESISYIDQNGSTQTITINYTAVNFNFAAMCGQNSANCYSYIYGGGPPAPTSINVNLPASFVLQNGDTYTITYADDGTGDVESLVLPTGGKISYTWNTTSTFGTQTTVGLGDTVATRTVTANGQSSQWQFVYSPVDLGALPRTKTVTVTDPNMSDTVYTCTYIGTTSNPYGATSCVMNQEDDYLGTSVNSTPLATKVTHYTATDVIMPTSTTFTWNATNQTTETDTQWDTGAPPSVNLSFGNKVSEQVYDFGSGGKGPLLSNTQYTYLHNQNSAYANANIVDRISQVSVYNSTTMNSSTLVAQANTTYDGFNQTSINAQSALKSTTGTTQHDNTAYSNSNTLRGLPTSVTRSGPSTTSVTTYTDYNDLGKPTISTNGRGYSTSYTYGAQNAFVHVTTLPPIAGASQTVTTNIDVNTGLLTSSQDQNSNTTTYTYDSLMRPHVTTRPDGGTTTVNYSDANHTTTSVAQSSSQMITSSITLDGLGRDSSQTLPNGATVDTTYDLSGHVHNVSNPYFSGPEVYTVYSYDLLGRMIGQTNPGGDTRKQWCYNNLKTDSQSNCKAHLGSAVGPWTDVADENGNDHQNTLDALGRLRSVFEPNGSTGAPSMETDYGYNTLGNLVSVNQLGTGAAGTSRSRSFTYNALSQLVSSTNPETGTTSYTYHLDGNIHTKTDARGVVTTYTYDPLDRLLSKSYSDSTTLSSCYLYDGTGTNAKGHLAAEWTQKGTCPATLPSAGFVTLRSNLNYNSNGELTSERQCAPGIGNCTTASGPQLGFNYDQAGNLTTMTNSVGAQNSSLTLINYYDAASRPCLITSNWSGPGTSPLPASLFQTDPSTTGAQAGYAPHGALQNWYLGSSSTTASTSCGTTPDNTINITHGYNDRLWLTGTQVTGQVP